MSVSAYMFISERERERARASCDQCVLRQDYAYISKLSQHSHTKSMLYIYIQIYIYIHTRIHRIAMCAYVYALIIVANVLSIDA